MCGRPALAHSDVEALLESMLPKSSERRRAARVARRPAREQQHDLALPEIESSSPTRTTARCERVCCTCAAYPVPHAQQLRRGRPAAAQAAKLGGRPAQGTRSWPRRRGPSRQYAQAVRATATSPSQPRHKLAADALHDAAWLELRHEMGAARPTCARSSGRRKRGQSRSRVAMWALGFIRSSESAATRRCDVRALREESEVAMVKARGLYGRPLRAADEQRALAIAHLKRARSGPLHFYSLLARTRLFVSGSIRLPFGMVPMRCRQRKKRPPRSSRSRCLPSGVLRAAGLQRTRSAPCRSKRDRARGDARRQPRRAGARVPGLRGIHPSLTAGRAGARRRLERRAGGPARAVGHAVPARTRTAGRTRPSSPRCPRRSCYASCARKSAYNPNWPPMQTRRPYAAALAHGQGVAAELEWKSFDRQCL